MPVLVLSSPWSDLTLEQERSTTYHVIFQFFENSDNSTSGVKLSVMIFWFFLAVTLSSINSEQGLLSHGTGTEVLRSEASAHPPSQPPRAAHQEASVMGRGSPAFFSHRISKECARCTGGNSQRCQLQFQTQQFHSIFYFIQSLLCSFCPVTYCSTAEQHPRDGGSQHAVVNEMNWPYHDGTQLSLPLVFYYLMNIWVFLRQDLTM